MMRLPALLAAKLAKARLARIFSTAQTGRLLGFVDAADVLHAGSDHPVSGEKIRSLLASPASIVWIGGSEPLAHPGIAHFVRALAPSGKYIFLETNGQLVRRRIHEFQPLPRVFLTVRLDAQKESEFALALEGLRAARLSGFFTAIRTVVNESMSAAEIERLRTRLLEVEVDGWLITFDSVYTGATSKAAEMRALLPRATWRWFSAFVERELLAQAKGRELSGVRVVEKPQDESCEEGVNVA